MTTNGIEYHVSVGLDPGRAPFARRLGSTTRSSLSVAYLEMVAPRERAWRNHGRRRNHGSRRDHGRRRNHGSRWDHRCRRDLGSRWNHRRRRNRWCGCWRDRQRHAGNQFVEDGIGPRSFLQSAGPHDFHSGQSAYITRVWTYHYGATIGSKSPTVAFKDTSTGTIYGPWHRSDIRASTAPWARARAIQGMCWTSRQLLDGVSAQTVPAGTYQVIDSDPTTWAYTSDLGNEGCAWVYGWSPMQ